MTTILYYLSIVVVGVGVVAINWPLIIRDVEYILHWWVQ